MHLETFPDGFYLISYGVSAVVLSIMAHRKNRNPIAWGLIGGLLGPCSLVYLAFLPRICPKCREECRGKTCLNCDPVLEGVQLEPAVRPLLSNVA